MKHKDMHSITCQNRLLFNPDPINVFSLVYRPIILVPVKSGLDNLYWFTYLWNYISNFTTFQSKQELVKAFCTIVLKSSLSTAILRSMHFSLFELTYICLIVDNFSTIVVVPHPIIDIHHGTVLVRGTVVWSLPRAPIAVVKWCTIAPFPMSFIVSICSSYPGSGVTPM